MAEIAFFGLGTMGTPMARNLIKAGHHLRVMVYQGLTEGPLAVHAMGALIADDLESMVEGADFIISVVPNDEAVREIYLNERMRSAVQDGAIIIEMTSCSPETVVAVQDYYACRNVQVLDAPITGALPKAIDGTLTIMGAGNTEAFKAAESVFAPLAERVFQLGNVGNGKLIKSMTNLLGAINLAAVGEFYRFSKAMGLDMAQIAEVVQFSAGGSTQFTRNFGKMAVEDFTPAFALALLRKDMGIALNSAQKAEGLSLPLGHCAYSLYQNAVEFDREDCSAIVKVDKA